MNECEALSERMPAVAAGREEWSSAERAHLRRCAECGVEWSLVRTAAALGEEPALVLDPGRIGRDVAARLSAARAADRRASVIGRRRIAGAGLAAAASIALAVGLGRPARTAIAPATAGMPSAATDAASADRSDEADEAPRGLMIPVPELETLDRAELESVLETMDAPLGAGGITEPGVLNDLNDHELELVLESWEG